MHMPDSTYAMFWKSKAMGIEVRSVVPGVGLGREG